MIDAIIILISVAFGWFLRDFKPKKLKKKIKEIRERPRPAKSEIITFEKPTDANKIAESKAKENLQYGRQNKDN